jgi:LmbE family N-acetylglucosaminyl deacetylase
MTPASLLSEVRGVVAIGAHPDDIEIGCGATIARLRRVNPEADVRWVVLSGEGARRSEAEESARRHLGDSGRLTMHDFRDGYLPYDDPASVKEALVAHRDVFSPDLVMAPRADDAHQDHALAGRLAGEVYRSQVLFHYEIAKYDGDLGAVNVFVPLSGDEVAAKIADVLASFPSQAHRPWFGEATFRGLMRLRGIEAGAESGYAEAFWAPRLIVA